ncbi:pre-piRNA 3'-exonuclease trimmer-like isoform X2 [Athalia rosae]|uniref:pre-piRNA 3'-exonuclease trimmer-like isoform X2 n=1 Tax=Athalia rosae TaxID=37344 RepID=UPI0020341732|nr:pre-piRNA 3'-exonuclease trimmer-like isoform X2 [Athalia rosae]
MYEVTASNFEELYPKICDSLTKSKFISFDGEFSSIHSNERSRLSLFDTIEEHYNKLRLCTEPCIIIQFGITTFDFDRDDNKYIAEVFNFHLFPKSAPGRDAVFEFQSSAIEFLCVHGFDFNKFTREGISYLSEDEEQELRCRVSNETIYHLESSISFKEQDELTASYFQISDWLKDPDAEKSMSLDTGSTLFEYIVQKEARRRFSKIWTESRNGKIIIQRVDKDLRKILVEKEKDKLQMRLIDSCIGFSKIFKLLVNMKKPIIGHNIIRDLIFMHQQFYKPLPTKYSDFKSNIHRLFPTIYDTKHLSFELRKIVGKDGGPLENWKHTGLSELYELFNNGKGRYAVLNSPRCELKQEASTANKKFHEAGWDSYCAGYCFIKMAHIFAVSRYGGSVELRALSNIEILSGPREYVNKVNLMRASTHHLNLGGPEPRSERPQWLYVKSLGPFRLNIHEIADMLSMHGSIDVKPFSCGQALVATPNHRSARDIIIRFRNSKEIYVAPYSLLRHSPTVKILLWGSVLISGGAIVWLVHRNLPKSTVS